MLLQQQIRGIYELFILTKTAFFNGLSENEIKTILNCLGAYQKSFKKSEIIYYSGDTVSDMGLVLSGSVNIVVNYYWGSSNIFNHIGQGGNFRRNLCDHSE